jgi:histidinol-phosphatase (PHP family)
VTLTSNFHTHTTYVDGKLPPEGMVEAALAMGCAAIGFSEHSHVPFDPHYSMTQAATREYAREINALKAKYEGTMDIYLGLERDYFSEIEPDITFDYVIGAVHYIAPGLSVDNGADAQHRLKDEFHHMKLGEAAAKFRADAGRRSERARPGDYVAVCEEYYALMAEVVGKTQCDVVAHFDLVTKYNADGSLFDATDPRYIAAALSAMDEILKSCNLFEVNTGAMYRLGNPSPYPSAFLLRELCKRGGEVMLASDSHDAQSLCHGFGEMRELLMACGFKYVKYFTKNGFKDEKL